MNKIPFFRVEKSTERGEDGKYRVVATECGCIIHITGLLSRRKANEIVFLFEVMGKGKALNIIDAVCAPMKQALDFVRQLS